MKIKSVKSLEVLDSRGKPTILTTVFLEDGSTGTAMVPSGASTGTLEAHELNDNNLRRYNGFGKLKAVKNSNTRIAEALIDQDSLDQEKIDQRLIEIDGTPNKSSLGANSILAASLSVAKASASSMNTPLYEYINMTFNRMFSEKVQMSLPRPMLNIFNGGSHANNSIDIQEFMIIPSENNDFHEGLRMSSEVYMKLKDILSNKGLSTTVGDEGGFAPNLKTNEEVIEHIIEAIEKSGYRFGEDIFLALDCAATEFFKSDKYVLDGEGKNLSTFEMIDYLEDLAKRFEIISIEDPLNENDWDGWAKITKQLKNTQVVGDDIFVTQEKLLQKGIESGAGNAILIKLNQVGTLSETLSCINLAKREGFGTIVSHRSGETEDTFISDLSVGIDAKQIKTGAPARSDRTAKYNRLLVIGNEIYP